MQNRRKKDKLKNIVRVLVREELENGKSINDDKSLNLKGLNSLLQKQFKNDSKILLYRETDRTIKNWATFNINRTREPKGTSNVIQIILDTYAKREYQNVPLRKNSKFAMTEEELGGNELNPFGENKYVVFPDEGADIISFDEDSKRIRNKIDFQLDSMEHFPEPDSKVLKEFYAKTMNTKNGNTSSSQYQNYLHNNWTKIFDLLESGEHSFTFNSFVEYLNRYFEKMKFGIHPDSDEVVFNGDKYLYVEKGIFQTNFKWNGNLWTLNN